MDSLIKRTRVRFGSTRQEDKQEGSSMEEDIKIPPRFLREEKRSQGWIGRQMSRQMSWDFDFSGARYPTAVAAAAYAVKTLEESRAKDQRMESYAPDKSLNKMKSKVGDPGIQCERPKSSAKIRGDAKPGPGYSMADAWEKEEMTSVRERYEKKMDTIKKWEITKMTNAKRKIERREAETDKRRMKTVQSYCDDIRRIQEVAEAAKGQAKKNRRKEEITVKERANKIRLTGKIPATCLCF